MDWTHRLRLRNLKMLLSLAQTRNISHSAAMLNTTQPGLSKWLKDLEDDIGLPLFERHARGLRPTPHGDVLIAHAQRVEAQFSQQGAVSGFRGDMSRAAVIEHACAETCQRNDRRGRHKTVEQHGDLMAPRRQDRTGDGGQFAPAQSCRDAERIA